jgi:hypothetical protein
MTQALLLQLAKQGNPNSIAALINAALWAESIRAKVRLEEDCLHVMLRSHQLINQHAAIAFLRRGLLTLQVESIHSVMAYAWKHNDDFPHWIAQFELAPVLPPAPKRETTVLTPRKQIQLPKIKELARQGDVLAIAFLLNRITKPLDVTARTALRGSCLHVLLEAESIPDLTLLQNLVSTELTHLQSQQIAIAKLYGRQKGDKAPAWTVTLEIRVNEEIFAENVGTSVVNHEAVVVSLPTETVQAQVITESPSPIQTATLEPQPKLESKTVPLTAIASRSSDNLAPTTTSPTKELPIGFDRPKRRFNFMEIGFAVAVTVMIYFMMSNA